MDTDGGGDDVPRVDAPASALNPTTLTCVTRTKTITQTDGSKQDQRTHFALVDGITRDSDFAIEQCDMRSVVNGVDQATGCNAGATCTNSGAAAPADPQCIWSRRSGTFTADGKLYVYCGSTYVSFNAQGTATSTVDSRYMTVKIYK
jgi:hypothetical protein